MTKERAHIENHLLIENKERKIVRFKLNSIQAKYDAERTNRDIILKARREGFSSYILALFLIDCLKTPNTRSVVVSHETGATQKLFDRVKRYIERFYDGNEFVEIPLSYNSRSELYFPETNSSFYIGTAGSKAFGRGDTIHNLHLSELALYDDPKELLTGILPAVPPAGRVVVETTAKGFNYFKEFWDSSKKGENAFNPHFFPWWMHDEYTLPGPDVIPDEEEKNLIARFQVTQGQLRWRRMTIREMLADPKKEGTMDDFHQEYPSDDFEAFISSGRSVFNQQVLKGYLSLVKDPLIRGYITKEGMVTQHPQGYVSIYEDPKKEESYVIGADVAEGLEKNDYSSAHVLSRQGMRVVATWHGHIDPDLYAQELVGLARFYRGAVIGVENNNHGLAVINKIRQIGYNGLYRTQRLDAVTKSYKDHFGWHTNLQSKPLMITELAEAIREQLIGIPEKETIEECLAYVRDENGHTNAPQGAHDDKVMSVAIALQMRKLTSPMQYAGAPVSEFRREIESIRQRQLSGYVQGSR